MSAERLICQTLLLKEMTSLIDGGREPVLSRDVVNRGKPHSNEAIHACIQLAEETLTNEILRYRVRGHGVRASTASQTKARNVVDYMVAKTLP